MKKFTRIISLFLICFFVVNLSACVSDPTSMGKITDPADPRFDPMKFSFFDYGSIESLRYAMPRLFPVGTDKSYVDKVLVDVGGARSEVISDKKVYASLGDKQTAYSYFFEGTTSYRELMEWGPITVPIGIVFDQNNKLVLIKTK